MSKHTIDSWCPECGPHCGIDEDGCCVTCGNGAMGPGANKALKATIVNGSLRAQLATARDRIREAINALGTVARGVHTIHERAAWTALTAPRPKRS